MITRPRCRIIPKLYLAVYLVIQDTVAILSEGCSFQHGPWRDPAKAVPSTIAYGFPPVTFPLWRLTVWAQHDLPVILTERMKSWRPVKHEPLLLINSCDCGLFWLSGVLL